MEQTKLDPKDCLDIVLTNFQLHVQKARNPASFGRQVEKAQHGGKADRVFSNSSVKIDDKTKTARLPIELEDLYALARKQGKKYIRFFGQKEGIPVLLGADSMEKIQAELKKGSKKYLTKEYNTNS